jgi:hypothetical protein
VLERFLKSAITVVFLVVFANPESSFLCLASTKLENSESQSFPPWQGSEHRPQPGGDARYIHSAVGYRPISDGKLSSTASQLSFP